MKKTILVGLDGSPCSDVAVELGIRWACRLNAELIGMAVVDEPTICKPEPVGIGGSAFKVHRDTALLADARQHVHEFLDAFAERCRSASVQYRVLEEIGLPSERLLSLADDVDVNLLGLETHFHFETQPNPCETLQAVLRGSSRPVVAVPQQRAEGKTVVVAYDASPPSVRALQSFQSSGLDEGQTVHVVSVAENSDLAARRAEEAARFLRFHDIPAESHPLPYSAPEAELIQQQVERFDARMLVMGVFGRSRLSELFARSTTSAILRRTDRLLFCHH